MPHKTIIKIFSASTLLLTFVRFMQLMFTINPENGFSTTEGLAKINTVLYTVMVIIAAIPTFFSAVSSNRQPTRLPKPKNYPILTTVNFIMAVTLLCSAGYTYITAAAFGFYVGLKILLLLLSAIWFLFYAIAGVKEIKLPNILSLAPVFLCLFRLIENFVSHNGLANISENIIAILYLSLLLLFFLLQSKILCKVSVRKSCRHIFPITLLTFMFMAVANIAPLIMIITGNKNMLHTASVFNVESFILGCYALIFTMELYSKSKWPASSQKQHSVEFMDKTVAKTDNSKFYIDHTEE